MWAKGIERLRRQIDAAGVTVADHVDRERPFRKQGLLTTKAWLKHRLQLSGIEAHRRLRVARMLRTSALWKNADAAGLVGVAQCELMSAVIENSRIDPAVWQADSCDLLIDAMDESYDEFEQRVRRWEMLADPDSAAEQAERNRMNRDAEIRPRPDGSWSLTASFDDIAAPSSPRSSVTTCRPNGTPTGPTLANGSVTRRRCSTCVERSRNGGLMRCWRWQGRGVVSTVVDSGRCRPVNYLIDQATYEQTLTGERIDPSALPRGGSRTQSGQNCTRSTS